MMGFLSHTGLIESDEQERERLAQSPESSLTHELSRLPVRIREWPQDLVIELPWQQTRPGDYRVVVVPIEHRKGTLGPTRPKDGQKSQPLHRHPGAWECVVVASDHPSYTIGGHRIIVSGAELARGRTLTI